MPGTSVKRGAGAIPPAAQRQALEWQVTFWSGEVTAAERTAFRQWLAADPLHERAWQAVQRVDDLLAGVPAGIGGRVLRLPGAGSALRPGRRTVLRALGWLAAGGVLAGAGRETPQWQTASAEHATRRGERRDIVLADGTRVSLNTATAIDVVFDGERRLIVLHDGEILVTTAPDAATPKRPFIVHTRQGSLQALGTRFSVRREEGAVQVAVYEGAVEIRPRDEAALRHRLDAGQQARFDARAVAAGDPAEPLEAAWARGLLVAERRPLGDFLAQLGRYRPGIVRCDPAVADLVVSGVYPLDDTDRILAALAEALPVRVDYATRYWVTVRARPDPAAR
jgi:transmembrane sensor